MRFGELIAAMMEGRGQIITTDSRRLDHKRCDLGPVVHPSAETS
jgi:hypothetical protein